MNPMREYLNVIITSPDGKREVQRASIVVPSVGDSITVRDNLDDPYIEGFVSEVHWSYRRDYDGVVVSVWLSEERP